jgi:hypothetical protein
MPHTWTNIFHGSCWIPDCQESEEINLHDLPENRSRFARLAILYGWLQAKDRQFLYRKLNPKLVYSHDHGTFFPSDLENPPALFRIDSRIKKRCNLTPDEIGEVKAALGVVSDEVIASAVAAPPEQWNFSSEDRVAMAVYLARARNHILS